MILATSRMSIAAGFAAALLGATATVPAGASPPPTDDASADVEVTIDLAPQLEHAASEAVRSIPVVDLGRVGPVDEEGTTFYVTLPAGTYADGAGETRSYARAAAWRCTAQAHNPHISSGAGGVIGKATVSCSGSAGTLPIQASLILGKNNKNSTAGMWFEKRATYTQNVNSNLGSTTWYVPQLGTKGAVPGGYFRTSVGAVTLPPIQASNIASHASTIVRIAG